MRQMKLFGIRPNFLKLISYVIWNTRSAIFFHRFDVIYRSNELVIIFLKRILAIK